MFLGNPSSSVGSAWCAMIFGRWSAAGQVWAGSAAHTGPLRISAETHRPECLALSLHLARGSRSGWRNRPLRRRTRRGCASAAASRGNELIRFLCKHRASATGTRICGKWVSKNLEKKENGLSGLSLCGRGRFWKQRGHRGYSPNKGQYAVL